MSAPDSLPPPVTANVATDSLLAYWRARAEQHTLDAYAGVPLSKFPEDLRVYEHLLWLAAPDVVIEIGTQFGGSALWFRDRLWTLERHGHVREPRVISIDVDQAPARHELKRFDQSGIVLVEGDVREPETPLRVEALLPPSGRCLVVEDSAHEYETTMAALRGFARFVPPGGFMVVEDGCVDIDVLRLRPEWPRGVLPALQDWLATPPGQEFEVRRDLELYGISCHPGGFLRRRD